MSEGVTVVLVLVLFLFLTGMRKCEGRPVMKLRGLPTVLA